MGIVLRLLGALTATPVVHEIDDREISRHREKNPTSHKSVFRAHIASENTHHSNAAKTVVAWRARQVLHVQYAGAGSSAPSAMKPANQKIMVITSTVGITKWCARRGKNIGAAPR
jgi:hypothetical protein